jgi:hypothetical protein
MLENMTLDTFAPLQGTDFELDEADRAVVVTLVEVKALRGEGETLPQGRREPFSLLFTSEEELPLEQRIYRLRHPQVGTVELFLVPMQPDESGSYLEAVFT